MESQSSNSKQINFNRARILSVPVRKNDKHTDWSQDTQFLESLNQYVC